MSERRRARAGRPQDDGDRPPEWLFRFRFGEWTAGATPDNPDPEKSRPGSPRELVEYCGARRRWNAARSAWLQANGRIMSAVWPETYSEYVELAAREPHRVVTPDWGAESDAIRERAYLLRYSGPESQQIEGAW